MTNPAVEYLQAHPNTTISTIRRHLGGTANLATLRNRLLKAGAVFDEEGRWSMPGSDLPAEVPLIERRKQAFNRAARSHSVNSYRTVNLGSEPYCIVHMGDPHLDDDGTDIGQIEKDLLTIRGTHRMFAGCVGDITNNWVGRLQAEYANQSSTHAEAWELAEWYFSSVPFLYVCIGNHSAWNHGETPLQMVLKSKGQPSAGEDMQLVIEHGPEAEPLHIHIRHDFPGHSQFNPVHGHMKAAYDGDNADILVSGHRHRSGVGTPVRRDGTHALALQVGSYKVIDDYAVVRGFRKHQISPCICTLVQPMLDGPDRVQVFWDVEVAARALEAAR